MTSTVWIDNSSEYQTDIYGDATTLTEISQRLTPGTRTTIRWSTNYHEYYISIDAQEFERWSATRVYTDPATGYHIELIHTDEGYYFARVTELDGCMSDGDTEAEARANILEAMEVWLEIEREDGCTIPTPAA